MELVLEADGETMQWANWGLVLCKVGIELLCVFDGGVEEDFV